MEKYNKVNLGFLAREMRNVADGRNILGSAGGVIFVGVEFFN